MNTRRILVPALCVALLGLAGAACFLWWDMFGSAPRESTLAGPAIPGGQGSAAPGGESSPPPMPDVDEIIRQATGGGAASGRRMNAMADEARRRAAEDPKAALAWAAGLPVDQQVHAVVMVVSLWAATDPVAAFDAALFLDEKNAVLRSRALTTVLTQWAAKDPAAAWKATQTLPSASKDRALIEMQIAMRWAGTDPSAAAKALQDGAALTGFYSELAPAFGTIAHELAMKDIAAAKTWSAALPDGPARSGAVSSVVVTLAQKDPSAAAEWLNQIGAGRARDAGVMALVSSGAPIAPADGMRWAETVAQPALRRALVSQFAMRWLGTQPDEAKAWLQGSTILTEKEKQEILDVSAKLPPIPGVQAGAR
jgi:hypothetical protein